MKPMKGFGCNETLFRLHAYVDRELTEVEMIEVKQHLDDCPPCEKHFLFEEQVKRLVHNKGCPERAPEDLITKILKSLRS
jgi:mycothiol system anti-sigma-R factor